MCVNSLLLSACVVELDPLRYTPAGLPAVNARLEHASRIQEFGQTREVKATIRAVAFGLVAERIASLALGSLCKFRGFVNQPMGRREVVFHIEEFTLS